jgi:hypothetical protein
MSTGELIEKHSLKNDLIYRFKIAAFTTKRMFGNLFKPPAKFIDKGELKNTLVISTSESELWNAKDNQYNWFLTAGKIENLRVASRQLNGIEVEANKEFSFWKHIGKPTQKRGYVVGREIREGCIVPTIAGGLCQMSNALYDAALKAGFEIVERHKHTRVIQGSLAEKDRDATVKWNYVDLRFRSTNSFRIEIEFTADKLVVLFKSAEAIFEGNRSEKTVISSKINDCYSCGNTVCFKHPGKVPERKLNDITAYILDEKFAEFESYLQINSKPEDYFVVPFTAKSKWKVSRFTWNTKNIHHVIPYSFVVLRRSINTRLAAKRKKNIPSLLLRYDERIVKNILHKIPAECTHIVLSQNLLPFAFKYGLLWGRTYDVLMTRLPMEHLHVRLDELRSNFPKSITASDFRANLELVELEKMALNKARKIISPHTEIINLFHNKSVHLEWQTPIVKNKFLKGVRIVFPSSALARKGAFEMKRLAKELNIDLYVMGKAEECADFWKGTKVKYTETLQEASLLILPAYVEHHPKIVLRALALGITVISTSACGVSPQFNLILVPIGDYEALKKEVLKFLEK